MSVNHGANLYDLSSQYGFSKEDFMDFSSNINPFGSSKLAKKYVINNDLDLDDSISYDTYENIDLQKALDELPEKYKTIVILRYFEDMKISEIAQVLDENTNTIKTRLYKALDKLKLKLRDDEE